MTGFATLYGKLQQKTSVSGKAESTLNNYARCLAHLALHFDCSPELLDIEQVEEYLHHLKKMHSTPSESFFKHTVYGCHLALPLPLSFNNALKPMLRF